MGVKIREKRGRLYLDIYQAGKRRWEALGLSLGPDKATNKETWHVAEIIRQKTELAYVSGEHGLIDPNEGRRQLVSYAEELAKGSDPKNPLPKSLRYLRLYAKGITVGSVNEKWIEGYRTFLLEHDAIGKSTASKYLSALTMVLRRAVRDRVIPRNPADAVRGIKSPEVVKVSLTPEELVRLAHTPLGGVLGAEVRRAFLFAALCGLRISDIRSLAWGDIDSEKMAILKRQKKTSSVVGIPIHESAWTIIKDDEIHRRDALVFPGLSASKTNTNQYLTTWAKAAGVDKQVGWHTARHTFAVLALDNGADIYTVSKLMGHTKIQTTAVYAKATDGMKRKAVDGLPGLDLKGQVKA